MNKNAASKSISIIIPVYNEDKHINSIIDHIKNDQFTDDIEIIVVDGHDEKNTLGAITYEDVIKLPSPKGRAVQMNAAASRAVGKILLFLHADTRLPEGALGDIKSVIDETDSVAGAFDLSLDNSGIIYKLTGKFASRKHRLTRIPFGDQAIFIEKKYFENIGGFSEIPLMEDVDLMKRIKNQKDKITIIKKSVITSSRKWEKEGVFYTIFRNWTLQALYLFGVSPEKLVKYYYGGKNHE